jgi:hypothetical protein
LRMRRIISVLAVVALMVAIMTATALPALADQGGVPNQNSCHGQVNKAFNSVGITPKEQAQHFYNGNAGAYNQSLNDYCVF